MPFVTNFVIAFIFLGASHVLLGFSLFPPTVIPSRADLAVPVLWPQPFLVIIPQPVSTSSDQCGRQGCGHLSYSDCSSKSSSSSKPCSTASCSAAISSASS